MKEAVGLQAVCTSVSLAPLSEHTWSGAEAPSPRSTGALRQA